IVDKSKVIDIEKVSEGDVIIGIASSGIHSNGYSLVRKVFDVENVDLTAKRDDLGGKSLGEALIEPTKIYVKPMTELFKEMTPHAVMHITGGGFYENIPRALPEGMTAKIDKNSLEIPAIFKVLAETGNIPERDMFNTYNMGVGMTVVVPREDSERALEIINGAGEKAYVIGEIVKGDEGVIIEG
ncbi:MAG: phosphoribosylformylglycinamidine cyclo-ligase, partial [Mogibacterium diversum]|nr:phosphoribosylformylglycinamidine cyclo-ligase [Mogibacterium diversum]